MNNEINYVSPFKQFVITIGNLPTAYLESMSYYEAITYLVNYLSNNVIPALNNNGLVVEEVQAKFTELKNYVDNYFDNLDVQEEINTKLDEMAEDGTLTTLIGKYVDPLIVNINNEINNFENSINNNIGNFKLDVTNEINTFKGSVNNEVNEINTKVNNAVSGSPLVASSTSEMTDTTRVYVNTSDGKWYYYDGDSWEIGGTYQSTGISDGSIDILKLDDELQKNYFINYSQPIDLGTPISGFINNSGTLVPSDSLSHYDYSLENGKSYIFGGDNISQLAALVITDSFNNVIYGSNPNNNNDRVNYLFKVNQSGLTAHISYNSNIPEDRFNRTIRVILRELTNIYNQLRYTSNVPKILTLNNKFISATIVGSDSIIKYVNYNDSNIDIYQMSKGRKYKIHGYNYSNICYCAITDINGNVVYGSSNSNIGNIYNERTIYYDSDIDGFIAISKFSDGSHEEATIEVINEGINLEIPNPLTGKKMGCDGDSIMKGAGNDNTSYANYICDKNDMTLQQLAIGGGTIAYGTYNGDTPRHWICTSVNNLDNDCDIVLINGGINDKGVNVPLGSYTDLYSGNVDNTTFYGALETLCRNLLNKFTNNTKIYFVTNHHVNDYEYSANSLGLTGKDYIDATKKVMKKYGIEIIDIGENTHLNTALTSYKNSYTYNNDGVHPNENGYKYFYNDYIEGILKQEL